MTLELGLIGLLTTIAIIALASFLISRQRRAAMPSDFRLAYVVNSIDAERAVIQGLEKSKIPYRAVPVKMTAVQDRFTPVEIYVSEMNINAAKTVLARLKNS
ncbi:MAG: hypothetical protein IPJ84_18265 [Bdellovibrionales bacterium]|nr:hypothetical protein [Bdellovibrionales bacterium]